MCDVVVKKFTFAVSSRDELLVLTSMPLLTKQYNLVLAKEHLCPTTGKVTTGLVERMCGWKVELCSPIVTHGPYLSTLQIGTSTGQDKCCMNSPSFLFYDNLPAVTVRDRLIASLIAACGTVPYCV